ncbi:hypothetical protein M9Y10_009529 [Tritrichomonas musculus]|uniref:Uncharacterized protein n=1 Tax=Tritrichomonas musculus TaxID=1915356 RepID=A0ABR2IPT3_9EUKA
MNQHIISAYFHKYGTLVDSTINKFREFIDVLQTRLDDFTYFHSNDEHSDIAQKSREVYQDTDKIITTIFKNLSSIDDKAIISKDALIDYIISIYKSIKEKDSIYSKLQKKVKDLCKSRDPSEFNEIFNYKKKCLNILSIQLNKEEEKLFDKKLNSFFENAPEIESDNDKDKDKDFVLSSDKEYLLGQVISEICLYNSIKLFKKSKSAFKDNLKKIDKAFKSENETFCNNLIIQLVNARNENESLKEANKDYEIKLNTAKEEYEELQLHLEEKNDQNKKMSDRIMELEKTPTQESILYNEIGNNSSEYDAESYVSNDEYSESQITSRNVPSILTNDDNTGYCNNDVNEIKDNENKVENEINDENDEDKEYNNDNDNNEIKDNNNTGCDSDNNKDENDNRNVSDTNSRFTDTESNSDDNVTLNTKDDLFSSDPKRGILSLPVSQKKKYNGRFVHLIHKDVDNSSLHARIKEKDDIIKQKDDEIIALQQIVQKLIIQYKKSTMIDLVNSF